MPWRILAACAVAVSLPGCGGPDESPPPAPPLVELVRVEAIDVEERIEASGELIAVEDASIAAEVEGQVTEVLVDEGSAVAEGDVLLRIDPERRELEIADVRARRAEANSALRESQRDYDRIKNLHARGAASSAQLDAAETALDARRSRLRAADAQLGVAQRSLRDASVSAPFAGLVSRRHVSRGEYVRAGTSLFDLVALDPIEVEFHLPEIDSDRASIGNSVRVQLAPFPDEQFEGRVSMVSPVIDPRTRTLRVKARLENASGRLRPGLFARADLGIARRDAVPMIPEEAVLQRADGSVVFRLLSNDRVERRNVDTGIYRGGLVEVVDGIVPGDWVVVQGHGALIDGAPVRAQTLAGKSVSLPSPTAAESP